MNIESRLGKLEAASNLNSESCTCPGERQTRVIEPDWDRTESEYQSLLADAERPETCDRCGKSIDRQIIIIEVVASDMSDPQLPDN